MSSTLSRVRATSFVFVVVHGLKTCCAINKGSWSLVSASPATSPAAQLTRLSAVSLSETGEVEFEQGEEASSVESGEGRILGAAMLLVTSNAMGAIREDSALFILCILRISPLQCLT